MQECRCVVSVGGDSIMIVQICVAINARRQIKKKINARRSSFARPYQIINLNQFGNKPSFFCMPKHPLLFYPCQNFLQCQKWNKIMSLLVQVVFPTPAIG